MNINFTNLLGYLAAAVGTCLMLPQVIKSYNTTKVDDLSFGTITVYIINCLLWLWYGARIVATPVVVANSIGLVIGVIQLALWLKYRTR